MLARLVDLCDHLRQCHALGVRDLLQTAPECVFEADAGLVAINDDRAFDDWGFHEQVLRGQSAGLEVILYGDSAPRLIAVETDGEGANRLAVRSPCASRSIVNSTARRRDSRHGHSPPRDRRCPFHAESAPNQLDR